MTQQTPGVPAAQAVAAEVNAAAQQADSTRIYTPGVFKEARAKFIKAARAEHGICHAAANDMWMASDLRASYLATLSFSEMKKRRFM